NKRFSVFARAKYGKDNEYRNTPISYFCENGAILTFIRSYWSAFGQVWHEEVRQRTNKLKN
ncbi:MAG: hypothetical protein UHS50_07520, partial [Bacteroidaceae bacterium]|nr:hypothetical protein [Bacteroidaceae bacterium]